jgi:hypothetical protein
MGQNEGKVVVRGLELVDLETGFSNQLMLGPCAYFRVDTGRIVVTAQPQLS